MGMFTQRPEEENTWAALPGEPLNTDASDALPVSDVDPFEVGMGLDTTAAEWIVFPVPPPASEAADHAEGEPEDPA
ncbi:hypothetical protein [Microbacterium tumbae]